MGVKFTQDQQKVIDTRGCNILVSAAAGSGKTAVLVERIVNMVCDPVHPVDIDRLLIVTFTKAAAQEMRERIREGLEKRLEADPENENLERQTTLLHNSLITTIDSFCLYVVKNHFHEVGLDPSVRVIDENEEKLYIAQVMEEMLEEHYQAAEEEFLQAIEFLCQGRDDSNLEEYILELFSFSQSHPFPVVWLEERKGDFDWENESDFQQGKLGQFLLDYCQKMLRTMAEELETAEKISLLPSGPWMYADMMQAEKEMMTKLSKITTLGKLGEEIQAVKFDRISAKKDPAVDPQQKETAKGLRDHVKKRFGTLKEQFFSDELNKSLEDMRKCSSPVCVLLNLAIEFTTRLLALKKEKKVLSFSDVEHYALDILLYLDEEGKVCPSAVAKEFGEHFAEILTDEYQDSNLVQEYILQAVSGEEGGRYNRFMVGDVKQSIYKFRLARPELFMEKYDTYQKDEGNQVRIDLSKNFRSRKEVLDAVNSIFERTMSKDNGGIAYTADQALYLGADYYPQYDQCKAQLMLLDKGELDTKEERISAEGTMIADKIKELRKEYLVTDKKSGELRSCEYRDIVILIRSNAGMAEPLKAALEKDGIPAVITSKTEYFESEEIKEVISFLKVLDNPLQNIPLFGTLRSVFGGFTDEEIAVIRSTSTEELEQKNGGSNHKREEFLWDNLVKKAQDADEIGRKSKAFMEKVSAYREKTIYLSVRRLLDDIIQSHRYLQYVTALPGGSKRRNNVELLLLKASGFEKTSFQGLTHFVRYINLLKKYEVDLGGDSAGDDQGDVVRIMTIHKSKGLEFPITFVAGMGKKFNLSDMNNRFLLNMDYGIGTDWIDVAERTKTKTIGKRILAQLMKQECLGEELRILYVALTRAKEKLIMTGTLQDPEKVVGMHLLQAKEKLGYGDFMSSTCYLDFVLPILNREFIDVDIFEAQELEMEETLELVEGNLRAEKLHSTDMEQEEKVVDEELAIAQNGDTREEPAMEKNEGEDNESVNNKSIIEEKADRGEKLNSEEKYSMKEVEQRFSYVYPFSYLQNLYTKTSVSELKIAAMEEKDETAYQLFENKEFVPYLPKFAKEEETVGGTQRGNAYHKVMEWLDFSFVYSEEEKQVTDYEAFQKVFQPQSCAERMKELLYKLVLEKKLLPEYKEIVSIKKLVHFVQSEIAFRMYQADRRGELYREQPFVYGISADRIRAEFPKEEKVLIQGIIDAFFIEAGKIVVLDYKTDRIGSVEELWNRYETQLDYYEEAISNLMKIPVKEKVLYSYGLEETSSKMTEE